MGQPTKHQMARFIGMAAQAMFSPDFKTAN